MIAVLDYGIGNLRSAEKALVHLGADARLVPTRPQAAGADGIVLPGVGAFGACADALRRSGLEEVATTALDARHTLPRYLRRLPAPLRGFGRGPGSAGPRGLPGTWWPSRRGQAAADAVE